MLDPQVRYPISAVEGTSRRWGVMRNYAEIGMKLALARNEISPPINNFSIDNEQFEHAGAAPELSIVNWAIVHW